MSKHTREDRPTEIEALLGTVLSGSAIHIEVATYNKRKFSWTRERIAYADIDWIIEDTKYSDDPIAVIVGGRIVYYNGAVDDLFGDYGTEILAGIANVDDGPIMQSRKKNAAKIAEDEIEARQVKTLARQIKKLNKMMAQAW